MGDLLGSPRVEPSLVYSVFFLEFKKNVSGHPFCPAPRECWTRPNKGKRNAIKKAFQVTPCRKLSRCHWACVLLTPENRSNGPVRRRNVHRSPDCLKGMTEIEPSIAAHAWLAASKRRRGLQAVVSHGPYKTFVSRNLNGCDLSLIHI